MSYGRILALDVGDKRIGVAVSDEMRIISSGVCTIERKASKVDLEKIKNLIKEHEVVEVIVGLPLTMKGTESKQTQKVKKFIDELTKAIEIPVIDFDERLSTAQGERMLISADVSRKKRKKVIDKIAAQLILQSYLELKGGMNAQDY